MDRPLCSNDAATADLVTGGASERHQPGAVQAETQRTQTGSRAIADWFSNWSASVPNCRTWASRT